MVFVLYKLTYNTYDNLIERIYLALRLCKKFIYGTSDLGKTIKFLIKGFVQHCKKNLYGRLNVAKNNILGKHMRFGQAYFL